ncbi:DNA-binding transcriptional LysR family regulator [Rhodopseudomonas rhenobacensis]|uniref:DNA-binding transcriptional LysR family regulator n=1 Tax=Rhodopseudomonas rhenobacensis TaxID=87461 RepID=A0A7W8DZJ1_9BRAD|nr:LysR substrate-binding domain-containing protein [Rhodopseudomonas rhenobacensis]MBB5046926.1 DNA-binding transcriptional LysR family regulator [Rhodopseudomonas rhenobacensis]
MSRRLPPLIPLRAFEAVGRTGSIRAAAEELSVSHSVVSHHLQTLQQQLRVKLVQARGRGIELTPEGIRFQEEIARSFDQIAQATCNLGGAPADRTLKIWCRPGLAERKLMPSLPDLRAKLRDRDIVLCPTNLRPDLTAGEADVEVTSLHHISSDTRLSAELLSRPRVFPIVSPGFLARYPEVTKFESLTRMPLLHEDSTKQWERWLCAVRPGSFDQLCGVRLWNAQLTIQAARLGQGIALSNDALVSEELAAGDLVEPIASNVRLWGYYVLSKASRWRDPAIVVVREWLHDICTAVPQQA